VMSNAGAWTLGPASFNGVHILNCEQLKIASTTNSSTSIKYAYGGSDKFVSYYYDVDGSMRMENAAGTDFSICSSAGAWTLGALTSGTHTIQSNSDPLTLVTTTANNHLKFMYSTSSVGGYIRSNATNAFNFLDSGASSIGFVSAAGAWTFGPSAGGAEHVAKGIITAECFVTASGSQSAAHNTATTFYTIPAQGHYIVSVWLNGVATTYGCFANVINSNGSGRIVSNDGGNATITLSGSTLLQVTQLSGSTQTMTWNVTKVGRI